MKQRLTAKEEEVMNIIWAKGEVFIRDIVAALPDPKPNYNTVATQVKFLEDKGFVKRKPMANSSSTALRSRNVTITGLPSGTLSPVTTTTPT